MATARFRFSTEILARLGEELNPSIDQGIIELVKNSYDADATKCVITFVDEGEPGGVLKVSDNGDGMTSTDLSERFLLLGSSDKDFAKRTRLRRIPAGSKGLGRLAALRSGRSVVIRTRPRSEQNLEHELKIDWSRFDTARMVDEVVLEVVTRQREAGTESGTNIEVRNLRRAVGRVETKRLARALLLLADPFADDPRAFKPELVSAEYEDLSKLVETKYFDSAEYHLHASVNKNGRGSAEVLDWNGKLLFKANHEELRQSSERYHCPPTVFDLWVFLLDARTFSTRGATLSEVRQWLGEFGGIMLYINGLRVAPFGDSGNDWLDLNLRRTQSPEERPSTLTSIGRLLVTDLDAKLTAKTDRGGIIDSPEFEDLQAAAKDALEWMARERLRVAEIRRQRHRRSAPRSSTKSKDRVEAVIAKSTASTRNELQAEFAKYDQSREREVRILREEVQLYRTLSTAGITAATFAHESTSGALKIIARGVSTLRRRLLEFLDPIPQKIMDPIEHISSSTASLVAFSGTTLDLVDRDKRRTGRLDVNQAIAKVLESYAPFLNTRDIDIQFSPSEGHPYLQGSVAAVESIIANLLTNAMTALENSNGRSRRIEVSTEMNDLSLTLRFADNGPGIQDLSTREIWSPGRTTKIGGSGLGLTIVRDTVNDLGGSVDCHEQGTINGAEFIIELPMLGA